MSEEITNTEEVAVEEPKQLSEEEANAMRLGVAKVARQGFVALAAMSDEELLLAFDKPAECKALVEAVNTAYQGMLQAELPQVFNNHIDSLAKSVVEKMFAEVTMKSNSNLVKLIEQTTGIDYDDMTPKQVVDLLEASKVE